MKKLAFAVLILSLTFGSCQTKYPDLSQGVYAEFNTNRGTFVAELYNDATPLTVANFVALAEGTNDMVDSIHKGKKYFNGLTFHRVIKDFMIQGGDPKGDGSGNPGYRFPDEFVDSLKHTGGGILSMANSGPQTNGSQFFITLKETPWLNGKHTIFGQVVMGQEIIDSIGVTETTKPGDKPVDPIIINEVNIIRKGDVTIGSFGTEMEKLETERVAKGKRMEKIMMDKAVSFATLKQDAEELPSGKGHPSYPALGYF
jgi:peptidylprolyl isomerase